MPAALVLGLKRQSGRWPETFNRVIMEHFCPRTIFLIQFGIPTQDPTQEEKQPRCLPASTR
jgi:hypothetical protein